jgi:hypothetical protein
MDSLFDMIAKHAIGQFLVVQEYTIAPFLQLQLQYASILGTAVSAVAYKDVVVVSHTSNLNYHVL